MINISSVQLGPEVEASVLAVLKSGILAQGPVVAEVEQWFAEMIGVPHVIAVNNGTTALCASIEALGLEPGDEVITSPFTFVATVNAILAAGATVRFADISDSDFNIDPDLVSAQVNDSTKAIMPVHLYGQCADMDRLMPIADEHGLAVIEDAAQAHGARLGGKAAGSWGIGCFSLYATKNLTSGEGGLISTSDDDLADRLRVLRNQGMRARYEYVMAGQNYRMTDLQASVLRPQLDGYEGAVDQRRSNATRMIDGLSGLDGVRVPTELPGREHVWHQFTLLVEDGARVDRNELAARLADVGIGSGIYYPKVVFDYDCYRDRSDVIASDVPVSERVARTCLSLPVHPNLSDQDVDTVIESVRTVMGGLK